MIVVLDTNVVVAALVAKGLCHEVVVHAIRSQAIASSALLFQELEDTLARKFVITSAVAAFLAALRTLVTLVEPAPLPQPICRDPDDDGVLGTAVAAKADAIVTGDQDLLMLGEYEGIAILSPRAFLERLGA